MFMTLSMSSKDPELPASHLGFLLHKHPDRLQEVGLSFGKAHLFYPESNHTRCTLAMLLDLDPVALARGTNSSGQHTPHKLWPYVNERPYVCSSFLSVAISRALGTALGGRCKNQPALVDVPLDLTVTLGAVPVHGQDHHTLVQRLFSPLGYEVSCTFDEHLDARFPSWGPSHLAHVTLRATHLTLSQVLEHLYVLIPVLDNHKHYYVGSDEVDKLMRRGERWLPEHPERNLITQRYLKRRRKLVNAALSKLDEEATHEEPPAVASRQEDDHTQDNRPSLHERRLDHVLAKLEQMPHAKVLDLGCGEGKMLGRLMRTRTVQTIKGLDISSKTLERAARRLKLDERAPSERARIELVHGSLHYCDPALQGFDVALLVEVIEHIEVERLDFVMQNVLGFAKPSHLIITTPNAEYNALFASLPAGTMRHADHRFEWTRAQFEEWCEAQAARHGYTVQFEPVGDLHDTLGAQTQMATFSRQTSHKELA